MWHKDRVPTVLTCNAVLFDLDGTLIDSLPAVNRAWTKFSLKHGLIPAEVLSQIHGKRSIDSIRRLLPHVDAEEEDAFIRLLETTDTEGTAVLPGALQLLGKLPRHRWAVVTSGTSDVAMARMRAAGIPEAGGYVFGNDVSSGKPAPDPFLLGATKLGFSPAECIGVEDTLAGVRSIQAAGMRAVGIGVEAELVVRNLAELSVSVVGSNISISAN
jgi:mannitol-1-/sugar-/sorbitol-6-phosphatase